MIYLFCVLLSSNLPGFSVTVDPAELEYLYEHFTEELEIPAVLHFDTLDAECTIAFRGGTSLNCTKKSWHIRLEDETLFPWGDHLLLNAQFRDASLMRNTLGLMMTRELGFPAPLTEYVTLEINGSGMGVYERVERIDRLFYQRIGLGFGPLFKNVDTTGRLVCQFADISGVMGFEPKIDSQPYGDELLRLIEACFAGDSMPFHNEEILALLAVNTAIADKDGLIKNIYYHLYQNVWHLYPWDRDATFGNSWTGIYDPTWVEKTSLGDIGYFGGTEVLLRTQQNIQTFNNYLSQCSDLMENRFPQIVDSLRLEIRGALEDDPYYEFSTEQFDSLCRVMSSDISHRGEYLESVNLLHPAPAITSLEISDCLAMEDEVEIELELSTELIDGVVMLVSFNGENELWIPMNQGDRADSWAHEIELPPDCYSVNIAFGPWYDHAHLPLFYPSWAMRGFEERPAPTPAARIALADLAPEYLQPDPPIWCGENLWVLPIVNSAPFTQDLSLCSCFLGEPSGSIFFHDSVLIQAGEKFYLSNNAQEAARLFQGPIFGDAGCLYPEGSRLELNDPSWNPLYSWSIGNGDSIPALLPQVIPSEISMGAGPDWIELFNPGPEDTDLSGWYLIDSDKNISLFPEDTWLEAGQLLTVWEEPPAARGNGAELQLDFRLSSTQDSLCLFNRSGSQVFHMGWDSSWPCEETGIIYLETPVSPIGTSHSWIPELPPGTPGAANPGWESINTPTTLRLISENPSNGIFSLSYQCASLPLEAAMFDMAGRIVARLQLPGELSGTINADFSNRLPSGIYIVYLRSSTDSDSVRLTVLAEE